MPSPILARADALMHRKRQNDTEFDDLPVLTDAIDEDDIPVLLDAEASISTGLTAPLRVGPIAAARSGPHTSVRSA